MSGSSTGREGTMITETNVRFSDISEITGTECSRSIGRNGALLCTMDYVDIPPVANRLPQNDGHPMHPQPRTPASINPSCTPASPNEPATPSPTKTVFGNLPAILLASTAGVPTSGNFSGQRDPGPLVSTRDPLSIPIISVNFRRFVSRIGPFFWLQDRIEEILTWKRGWKVTTVWMAIYTFLCPSLFSRWVSCSRAYMSSTMTPSRLLPKVDPSDSQRPTCCDSP